MSQDKPSRLNVYLQEYDKLKDEQTSRIGFRDNLLYVNLATIGAVLSFIFSKESSGEVPKYVALLVVPWISSILGWTYLINDDKIYALGDYFKESLSINIKAEIGEALSETEEDLLLGWEKFNKISKRRTRRKILQLVIDEFAFVAPAFLSVISYFSITPSVPPMLQYLCWIELVISGFLGIEIFLYSEIWKIFKSK